MEFLIFYPKGRNLFIEFIPDKYIEWQPRTENEITEKLKEVIPLINELREYCRLHNTSQVFIIDCDKAIEFDRINYVLMCKMVSIINEDYPDPNNTLKRIEVRHCHPSITAIFNSSKVLLPKVVADIFQLYSK
jgi:hypothetical protein